MRKAYLKKQLRKTIPIQRLYSLKCCFKVTKNVGEYLCESCSATWNTKHKFDKYNTKLQSFNTFKVEDFHQ